ncbi:hypothetical protein BDK51DRAFT_41436 [Blyttiomyces helicus]|uniref:Uncharacterized protein n=1 Tax=Blyttiomyces helicus TaxID=388810 RepID=A0A4P9W5U2_9FUNG|nr:hypothetical protein BDK51DRAFT_41436 [Blyttiomyces helicus]|eukprot:RKO86695.1 hypothetical protein BDK51DRAFT_41436 [Blyttiomyces helicus]
MIRPALPGTPSPPPARSSLPSAANTLPSVDLASWTRRSGPTQPPTRLTMDPSSSLQDTVQILAIDELLTGGKHGLEAVSDTNDGRPKRMMRTSPRSRLPAASISKILNGSSKIAKSSNPTKATSISSSRAKPSFDTITAGVRDPDGLVSPPVEPIEDQMSVGDQNMRHQGPPEADKQLPVKRILASDFHWNEVMPSKQSPPSMPSTTRSTGSRRIICTCNVSEAPSWPIHSPEQHLSTGAATPSPLIIPSPSPPPPSFPCTFFSLSHAGATTPFRSTTPVRSPLPFSISAAIPCPASSSWTQCSGSNTLFGSPLGLAADPSSSWPLIA